MKGVYWCIFFSFEYSVVCFVFDAVVSILVPTF